VYQAFFSCNIVILSCCVIMYSISINFNCLKYKMTKIVRNLLTLY
jgi:hypothetical protein